MLTGRIDGGTPSLIILAFSLAAALTDFIWGRIFNSFNLVMLLTGLLASFLMGGWPHLLDSLLGVGAAFFLYGWMFFFKFMGGGDVKFLMALGAWGGLGYVAEVAGFAVMVGGAMALMILVFKGRIGSFVRRMHDFFLTLIVKELEFTGPKLDKKHTMPFGIPIAIAAVWVAFAHPLRSAFEQIGVHL